MFHRATRWLALAALAALPSVASAQVWYHGVVPDGHQKKAAAFGEIKLEHIRQIGLRNRGEWVQVVRAPDDPDAEAGLEDLGFRTFEKVRMQISWSRFARTLKKGWIEDEDVLERTMSFADRSVHVGDAQISAAVAELQRMSRGWIARSRELHPVEMEEFLDPRRRLPGARAWDIHYRGNLWVKGSWGRERHIWGQGVGRALLAYDKPPNL